MKKSIAAFLTGFLITSFLLTIFLHFTVAQDVCEQAKAFDENGNSEITSIMPEKQKVCKNLAERWFMVLTNPLQLLMPWTISIAGGTAATAALEIRKRRRNS